MARNFYYRGDHITLGQLLKAANVVSQGSDAKPLIADGLIKVNGEIETRRGRKLRDGDVVTGDGFEPITLKPKD